MKQFPDRKARSAAMRDEKDPARLHELSKIPLESVQIRAGKAQKAAKHREKCEKYGEMIRNRQISIKKAAFACDVSIRQMHRYLAKAIAKFDEEVMNDVR